jgi:hypothetical protein
MPPTGSMSGQRVRVDSTHKRSGAQAGDPSPSESVLCRCSGALAKGVSLRTVPYAYLASVAVVVLAVLCVVGALVGQKLRNMRRRSSMVRKPHTFRGGGHWCATCEEIHRLIREAVHKFNNLRLTRNRRPHDASLMNRRRASPILRTSSPIE